MNGYPKHFTKLLGLTFFALLASGVALAPSLLQFRLDIEVPDFFRIRNRTAVAAIHVGTGLATCAFLGALWAIHMRSGWKRRKNRPSGSALSLAFVVLALSGIGGLYLGNEAVSRANGIIHLSAGLTLPAVLLAHAFVKRRKLH